MLHYFEVHLEGRLIIIVIVHAGINIILRNSSQSNDGLLQDIKNMFLKCEKFGLKNIISRLIYTTRINIAILEKTDAVFQKFCHKYDCFYVDNRKIQGNHLNKDDIHLMEAGKIVLARDLIFCLNKDT